MRNLSFWLLAVVVTLGSAVWQRMTGPTHPLRVSAEVAGVEVRGRLTRSGVIDEPVAVILEAGEGLSGEVRWRRWPSDDPWETIPLRREGPVLVGELPGLPQKAAKVDYQVVIWDAADREVSLTTRLRFKGAVPDSVLAVHILAMFLGMLFSFRAGLEALVAGPGLRWQTAVTLVCLGCGGLMLGPVVQKYAFDAYWTGWPVGEDLTDNKLAVAVLAWLVAAWRQRHGERWWTVAAAAVTLIIFLVPHSLHGSTHDWETGEHIHAALRSWWPRA